MKTSFGMRRVMEPKNQTPISAWKIDNTMKMMSDEAIVNVEIINFESDCFEQLYSSCEYDEKQVKDKIFKIVEERGKFHNPYTESSGIFIGTIEKAGKNFNLAEKGLSEGDRVVCISPLAGLPLKLKSINNLHYYYDQAEVDAKAICFNSTQLKRFDERLPARPFLKAIDEGATFVTIKKEVQEREFKSAALIGGTMTTVILYAAYLRAYSPENINITYIADNSVLTGHGGRYRPEEFKNVFSDMIDRCIFVDLADPMTSADYISGQVSGGKSSNQEIFDGVLVLENIQGSESLATLIVKNAGLVGYVTLNNRCNIGVLLADCIGKEVLNLTVDGYSRGGFENAIEVTRICEPYLKILDGYYKQKIDKNKSMLKAGKVKENTGYYNIENFVFSSDKTRALIDNVLNIAKYDCNVIIQGETGVGKEKIFDILHNYSQRNDKPCVRINCATIQASLAESEFFGYEKGAFTGALNEGKSGYFETANNGTLFLDEIGSLGIEMQAKLLRALQDNSFYKVGGTKPVHVNVRIIAANNVPLKKLVKEGRFREDLFYRLDICEINIPPLRERKEDIRSLADAFLSSYSRKYGEEKNFDDTAYRELEKYHWPGNVRELENAVHRLYISCRGKTIDSVSVDMLLNDNVYNECFMDIRADFNRYEGLNFEDLIEEQERKLIAYALKKEGTTRKAAAYLGLPQATLARKKVKYGL